MHCLLRCLVEGEDYDGACTFCFVRVEGFFPRVCAERLLTGSTSGSSVRADVLRVGVAFVGERSHRRAKFRLDFRQQEPPQNLRCSSEDMAVGQCVATCRRIWFLNIVPHIQNYDNAAA